jgi:acetyl-CoA synthetase
VDEDYRDHCCDPLVTACKVFYKAGYRLSTVLVSSFLHTHWFFCLALPPGHVALLHLPSIDRVVSAPEEELPMSDMMDAISAKSELYYPAPEVVAAANVPDYMYARLGAIENPVAFWDARAKELLDWYEPYTQILDSSAAPFFKWFVGGKTNIVHNALDRHVKSWRKNKLALLWEGEDGEQRTYSYFKLWKTVNRFANVLKAMGVKKGDTVTIYMGRVPELPIAMLAVAKIGAIHSVVYGGFSEQALADRIADARSKVVVTCDGAWLRGKTVNLKEITDEAVNRSPVVQKVIVYKRTGQDVHMAAGRDFWWHELMALPIASPYCETEVMDAEDPLFILYTSGTTGKPKGLLHTTGGYQVHIATTLKYVFDLKEEDRYWCAADPGWITGHSYIVYAPLILGATSFMYEGAPGYPLPDRWWQLIEKYNITILYTAPTAIRSFMRFGEEWTNRHDLSSLRLLGSVGEPINPEAWRWYFTHIGHERCPIMDTWWQTETGGFMITPTPVCRSSLAPARCPSPASRPTWCAPMASPPTPTRRATWSSSTRGRAWRAPSGATRTAIVPPTGRSSPSRAGTSPATARAATRTATSGSSGAWTT